MLQSFDQLSIRRGDVRLNLWFSLSNFRRNSSEFLFLWIVESKFFDSTYVFWKLLWIVEIDGLKNPLLDVGKFLIRNIYNWLFSTSAYHWGCNLLTSYTWGEIRVLGENVNSTLSESESENFSWISLKLTCGPKTWHRNRFLLGNAPPI